MKRKNIIGLIAIVAIVAVVMFAGCVEEETPVSAPTPTATPSQKITPTPTPAPSPIETPIPTPTLIPTREVEEDKSPVILKVTSSNIKKKYSYYEITGTIKNEGTATAEYVKMTIKLYDKDRHLIGSGYTYTDLSEITPKEESTFSMLIKTISDTPCENYEIIPTYSKYS